MAKTSAKHQTSAAEYALIEEFKKNPIGHHSAELQVLLNKMRGAPMADKYCLVVVPFQ